MARRPVRRCSVCGSAAHDKRAHARRRNPRVVGGVVKPSRKVALAEIRADVARNGRPTMHAIRMRVEGRVGAAAFNQAVREGLTWRARNPDFFYVRGRAIPIRTPYEHVENYDYQEGARPPPKKSRERGGPRGGYTYELPERDVRGYLAGMRRQYRMDMGLPLVDRAPAAAGAYDRLSGGKTKAEKDAAKRRRIASRGF